MRTDTHEFPLCISIETVAALQRYQIKFGLETMEDAARQCLRDFLVDQGYVELEHPPSMGDLLS